MFVSRNPVEQAKTTSWILTALQAGDRHIDTAWKSYGTGKFIEKASGIPRREELFITVSLFPPMPFAVSGLLKNAGLDYFDLYLVLWPHSVAYDENESRPENPDSHGQVRLDETGNFNDTWAEMKKVLASGKVKAIGLSNFSIRRPQTEALFKTAKIMPTMLQELYLGIKMHSYLAQNELLAHYKEKSITTAYAPIGQLEYDGGCEIASHNEATPAQLIISWHVGRSAVVVAKSADAGGQKQNCRASLTENYHLIR
ncbi:NADP-dependent oxidoreductase domain-containing protein [Suillus tomentosus]|nr:NADP-dependent oxidoreductase domain-containing protein [Suillus tomentosus]